MSEMDRSQLPPIKGDFGEAEFQRATNKSSDLHHVEDVIGYKFGDRTLLRRALTHPSVTMGRYPDYERLEFLGDAVLQLVVTERLMASPPRSASRDIRPTVSGILTNRNLARLADKLDFGSVILVNREKVTEVSRRGRVLDPSILADSLEAVVGGVFRDGGLDGSFKISNEIFNGDLTKFHGQAPPLTVHADTPELIPDETVSEIEEIFNYTFKDKNLAKSALIRLTAQPEGIKPHFQNLRILGGSVFRLAVSDVCHEEAKSVGPGHLSDFRELLTRSHTLTQASRVIGLRNVLEQCPTGNLVGKAEGKCLKAIMGAIYIDGGYGDVRRATREVLSQSKAFARLLANGWQPERSRDD